DGVPLAVKCTTSPVRAVVERGSIVKLRKLLFTTVTVVVPLAPSAEALILAVPGPIPVTTPPASTVATEGLSEVQLIFTPVRGSPLKIRVVASICNVLPTAIGDLIV